MGDQFEVDNRDIETDMATGEHTNLVVDTNGNLKKETDTKQEDITNDATEEVVTTEIDTVINDSVAGVEVSEETDPTFLTEIDETETTNLDNITDTIKIDETKLLEELVLHSEDNQTQVESTVPVEVIEDVIPLTDDGTHEDKKTEIEIHETNTKLSKINEQLAQEIETAPLIKTEKADHDIATTVESVIDTVINDSVAEVEVSEETDPAFITEIDETETANLDNISDTIKIDETKLLEESVLHSHDNQTPIESAIPVEVIDEVIPLTDDGTCLADETCKESKAEIEINETNSNLAKINENTLDNTAGEEQLAQENDTAPLIKTANGSFTEDISNNNENQKVSITTILMAVYVVGMTVLVLFLKT